MPPEDQDWKRYSEAGAAKQAIDLLEDHFSDTQGRMDRDLFKRLDQGVALSSEDLLQFVHMKYANHKLMQKLEIKLRNGQAAGQRLNPLYGANNV